MSKYFDGDKLSGYEDSPTTYIFDEKDKQIAELKHQLGEKETEIYNLNSVCIEQLEKVKELCREKFNWWKNSEWEGDIYDKADVSNAYFDIEVNIEEKIKQLKGDV